MMKFIQLSSSSLEIVVGIKPATGVMLSAICTSSCTVNMCRLFFMFQTSLFLSSAILSSFRPSHDTLAMCCLPQLRPFFVSLDITSRTQPSLSSSRRRKVWIPALASHSGCLSRWNLHESVTGPGRGTRKQIKNTWIIRRNKSTRKLQCLSAGAAW